MAKNNILIVEDHELTRFGLKTAFESYDFVKTINSIKVSGSLNFNLWFPYHMDTTDSSARAETIVIR
jgi:hypothetical protein